SVPIVVLLTIVKRSSRNEREGTSTPARVTDRPLAGRFDGGMRDFKPAHFPFFDFEAAIPYRHRTGQFSRTPTVFNFDRDLIAARKHLMDVVIAHAASIYPQDRLVTPLS